ncbi:hypothetical protein BJV74DRAFT_800235 [Russula compacta]|nr:hypothetical protein BJV74DRAFT_800235 [Russula compacta]
MPTPELHCPLWCWQVCECVQVKAGAHGQVEASGHGGKVGVGKCAQATVGRGMEVKLTHRTIFLTKFVLGSFGHALFNPEGKGGKRAWVGRWGQAAHTLFNPGWVRQARCRQMHMGRWRWACAGGGKQAWAQGGKRIPWKVGVGSLHFQSWTGEGGTGRETRDKVGKEELVWVTSQKGGARVHDPSVLQHETKQPSHRGKRKGPSMV